MSDYKNSLNEINNGNIKLSITGCEFKDIIFQDSANSCLFTVYHEGEKEIQMSYNKNNSFLSLSGKQAQKFQEALADKELHPIIYKEFSDRLKVFEGNAKKYDINIPHGSHGNVGNINLSKMTSEILSNIDKVRTSSETTFESPKRKLC